LNMIGFSSPPLLSGLSQKANLLSIEWDVDGYQVSRTAVPKSGLVIAKHGLGITHLIVL